MNSEREDGLTQPTHAGTRRAFHHCTTACGLVCKSSVQWLCRISRTPMHDRVVITQFRVMSGVNHSARP